MTWRVVRWLVAGALLLVTASHAQRPGSYGATAPPPVPGSPRFVQLESFEGLPRDSISRAIVAGMFRGAFAEFEVPVEKPSARAGEWLPDGMLPTRFRWLEGAPADSVWTIRVVLGFPRELPRVEAAPRSKKRPVLARARPERVSRGLNVVVAVVSPEARFGGARPLPVRTEVVLPADTSGTYPWEVAGQAAAFLALEALHRASGDLPEPLRIRLDPTRRREPSAR